jgi:uncharacterized membrane protein
MYFVLAFLIGVVAGLRVLTALAAVSWAVRYGKLFVAGTAIAFLGWPWIPPVLTLFAILELVTDQLPQTPSRTLPVQFFARIVSGAISGAAVGSAAGSMRGGLIAGVIGAVLGTFAGAAARARLAKRFHKDRPAALTEDAVAITGAVIIALLVA